MNHKHRKTLESLFSHPISGNITMKDVECKRRSNNPSLKRPDNLVAPE